MEIYAKKFGLILKNTDEIAGVTVEESDTTADEIFELDLDFAEPLPLKDEPLPLKEKRAVHSSSRDSEGTTDLDSPNGFSEESSPYRVESTDRSSSSVSISSGLSEVPNGLPKKLSPLFKSITVTEPNNPPEDIVPEEKVSEKKERIRWIDVPQNTTSMLTEQMKNPPPEVIQVVETGSQQFLKELARPKPQAASSAPTVLISLEEFLEVPVVKREEEWISIEWSEHDDVFPVEL